MRVDTQLAQRSQLVARPYLSQHLAYIPQQRASGRVVGERAEHQIVIGVTAGRRQRLDRILQGVVGIDKALDRLLQAIVVRRHGDRGRRTAGGTTGLGTDSSQLQGHATDSTIELVGGALYLQTIDGQLGILSLGRDEARAGAGHLRGTVNGQRSNTSHGNIGIGTRGRRAEHKTGTTHLVNDVRGNAVGAHFLVDLVAHALQRGAAGHIQIIGLAALADGQLASADRAGGAASELLAGYFRTGSQFIHHDVVATRHCGVAGGNLDHRLIGRLRRIGIE
ncbi:hypothetical protein D3C72_889460 [compost metagenome]